ncbi:IclR family transcriptional regulator C-terminal domain-containing protein [Streptomyces filamentosus]|uniref:IclR family transcriptional regulator domain-containing protein n=1 Tax=Streptomyces filamentosus TaxID=67294 RepID=UPI0036F189F0
MRELVAWGGLERGADGRYRLGLRLRVLGAAAPCPRGLLDAALRALGARTGGHADLAVRSAPPSGGVLRLVSGERPPPHATAYGQVLPAAPPVERPRFTRHTVVAPGAPAGRPARVRAAGPAVCAEEFRLGEVSVAAPVRGPAGTVAALGVTVPTGVPLDRVAAAVREAARRVRPPEPPPS